MKAIRVSLFAVGIYSCLVFWWVTGVGWWSVGAIGFAGALVLQLRRC